MLLSLHTAQAFLNAVSSTSDNIHFLSIFCSQISFFKVICKLWVERVCFGLNFNVSFYLYTTGFEQIQAYEGSIDQLLFVTVKLLFINKAIV